MLQSFHVTGLNGSLEHKLMFNKDLNIVTGRNGSGKTSLLKLLWYLFSGNIERTLPEIEFKTADLKGTGFRVRVDLYAGEDKSLAQIIWKIGKNKERKIEFPRDGWENCDGQIDVANREIAKASGSSLFFPTFRRIEGGFSTVEAPGRHMRARGYPFSVREALQSYVSTISVFSHDFITTVSTDDIERLLTKRYADMSEETNRLHQRLSNFITSKIDRIHIGKDASTEDSLRTQQDVLKEIREEVDKINKSRESLMAPFSTLSKLISNIFQHKGIALTTNITFGEAAAAVQSEKLSAGEKQMLSFLCYNAFLNKSVIIIDEPEISLHADWQRILFPTLLQQSQDNQFIVATHSPMIYAKYPEKELLLSTDRGDELHK